MKCACNFRESYLKDFCNKKRHSSEDECRYMQSEDYPICPNIISSHRYTMFLTCRTDRSNSSASGSKHIPSMSRLFMSALSRSECTYSSISLFRSELGIFASIIFFFSPILQRLYHGIHCRCDTRSCLTFHFFGL